MGKQLWFPANRRSSGSFACCCVLSMLWCDVFCRSMLSSPPVPRASCVPATVLHVIFHFVCLHLLHARLMSARHLVYMLSPCFVHVRHRFSCGLLPMHALHMARAVMAQRFHTRVVRESVCTFRCIPGVVHLSSSVVVVG